MLRIRPSSSALHDVTMPQIFAPIRLYTAETVSTLAISSEPRQTHKCPRTIYPSIIRPSQFTACASTPSGSIDVSFRTLRSHDDVPNYHQISNVSPTMRSHIPTTYVSQRILGGQKVHVVGHAVAVLSWAGRGEVGKAPNQYRVKLRKATSCCLPAPCHPVRGRSA